MHNLMGSSITYKIYHSFEDLKDQADDWDLFASSVGSTVYMSYDWCCTWWKHYGKDKMLVIVIFHDEDNIVAILPMYIDDFTLPFFHVRVARIVGSNIPPKVFDPPIEEERSDQIFITLVKVMIEILKCDTVSFGPLSSQYGPLSKIRDACQMATDVVGLFEEIYVDVHTLWFLPNSFEIFLNSLGKNERKNRRKYELRYLKSRYGVKVDILSTKGVVEGEFEKFQEMHTRQWQSEGKPGHFNAWPGAISYNSELVRILSNKKRVRLIQISADNEVISWQYGFVFGKRFFWELPARVVGDEWNPFDLGRTGVANMIQWAIEDGMEEVAGGLGHYDYKVRLGAKEFDTIRVRVTAKSLKSRIKSKILDRLIRLLDILYYKLWYRRVQPHLPSFLQRPIWQFWASNNY